MLSKTKIVSIITVSLLSATCIFLLHNTTVNKDTDFVSKKDVKNIVQNVGKSWSEPITEELSTENLDVNSDITKDVSDSNKDSDIVKNMSDSNKDSDIVKNSVCTIASNKALSISDNKLTNPSVTIIGDSVTLGAEKELLESIPNSYVDAKISRALKAGYNIFKDLKQSNKLGDYVVIALGTNDIPAFATYIEKFIDELPSGKRLIFVTPYDGRWTVSQNSYKTMQYLRSIKDKYDFVTIADWAANASSNPEVLCPDKVHISCKKDGIKLYVQTVISAINDASNKNTK